MINRRQLQKTFLDLLRIDSPSGEEREVAFYIVKYFSKIGIRARTDSYGNVLAKVRGRGDPLLISAHMDVVSPCLGVRPIVKGDTIRSDGTTVLGADDKAGIASALEAVKYLLLNKIKHRPLELIFTKEEESWLRGSANLNYKRIKAREGIVIDSGRRVGTISMLSPSIYNLVIRIKGKSAHSGADSANGINALKIAAEAIVNMKLGRINSQTAANFGIIKGGESINAVPGNVEIKGEVRSYNKRSALSQIDKMHNVFKKIARKYGAGIYFKSKICCKGTKHKKTDEIIKKIDKTNKSLGIKTVYRVSGGGSDANIFNAKGIKTVDIAYGGKMVHTKRESIKMKELAKITNFVIEFAQ